MVQDPDFLLDTKSLKTINSRFNDFEEITFEMNSESMHNVSNSIENET